MYAYISAVLRHKLPFLGICLECRTFPLGYTPLRTFPRPDNLPPHLGHSPTVKARIWKLALTHIPDPNRPTTRGPDINPNQPTRWEFFWKVALTCIPDLNRSTAIYFVDVNGRSLYIVDWQMVVVERGNVLHRAKMEAKLSGEYVREEMSADPLYLVACVCYDVFCHCNNTGKRLQRSLWNFHERSQW